MRTKPNSREYGRALPANDNIHEDTGHIYRSLPLSGNGMLQLSEDRVHSCQHSYFLHVR